MKHPLEKLIKLEIISMIIAIIATIFVLVKGYTILLFLSLFLLSLSMLFDSFVFWSKHDKTNAIKHSVKGIILLSLTMYLTLMLKIF